MPPATRILALLVVAGLLTSAACRGADEPEIVAIAFLRAAHQGKPEEAVSLVDIERLVERVEEEVVIVQGEDDPQRFMRESVETILWGLFQQAGVADYSYDAAPAEVEDDRATVTVRLTDAQGTTTERMVHLRRTVEGWRVSGPSLDPLESYVIQRLEERY